MSSGAGAPVRSNLQVVPNNWVMVAKDGALEEGSGSSRARIIKLRHPGTWCAASFLFSPSKKTVYELVAYTEQARSWFIGESVKSDGKLYLSTPIDPLFLILPYVIKRCEKNAIPLDQLLIDDQFGETGQLLECLDLRSLSLVADQKGDPGFHAFQYNSEKTLHWLERKVERLAVVLKAKGVQVGEGAVSGGFVCAREGGEVGDRPYVAYAHGIIASYLDETVSEALRRRLGLGEEQGWGGAALKRAPGMLDSPVSKRQRTGGEAGGGGLSNTGLSNVETLPPKSETKSKQPSAKDKARSKAASHSRNISSFFTKK